MFECFLNAGLTYEEVCSFEPQIFDEDDMEWRDGPLTSTPIPKQMKGLARVH